MLYNINTKTIFETSTTIAFDPTASDRHGPAADQIATACGAWADDATKKHLIESGTVKELEEDHGAADSTHPIAAWLSMVYGVSPESVLEALYDDRSSAYEQVRRICVVPADQVKQFVYDMLVVTKECWSLKFEAKFSDPARENKRWMHLAGVCQPWSNVEFDWKFDRAFAVMLGIEITDDEVAEIWRTALTKLVDSLGGLESAAFKDYVRENSAEYVRNSEDFDVAFEQLVEKLRAEMP